jgi:hypothetical protein
MLTLCSNSLSIWPRARICKREFHFANICYFKTREGFELELLFDENGFPLTDKQLIHRIQAYYRKKFIPVRIDGQRAYANVIHRKK